MRRRLALLVAWVLAALPAIAFCADDEAVVGVVRWRPGEEPDATMYDKTDYWSAIAISPSTGKYGSTCEWSSRDNASRAAREGCNAEDARLIVMCCNGWCALAMGEADGKPAWGVGWGPDQESAEKFALESARERDKNAKVVYSVFAREMRVQGAIAYSPATGKWGYSCGYGRGDVTRAVKFSGDPDAKVFVSPNVCCWIALAVGEDKSVWGWGYAGNRIDAEQNAMAECDKRAKGGKIAGSFCTNGKTPE